MVTGQGHGEWTRNTPGWGRPPGQGAEVTPTPKHVQTHPTPTDAQTRTVTHRDTDTLLPAQMPPWGQVQRHSHYHIHQDTLKPSPHPDTPRVGLHVHAHDTWSGRIIGHTQGHLIGRDPGRTAPGSRLHTGPPCSFAWVGSFACSLMHAPLVCMFVPCAHSHTRFHVRLCARLPPSTAVLSAQVPL